MLMLLGNIWLSQVFVIWNVSHTQLVQVLLHHAEQHVLTDNHSPDIRLIKSTVSIHHKDKQLCILMDQLKPVSMFMKIS